MGRGSGRAAGAPRFASGVCGRSCGSVGAGAGAPRGRCTGSADELYRIGLCVRNRRSQQRGGALYGNACCDLVGADLAVGTSLVRVWVAHGTVRNLAGTDDIQH
jgi:hypothetical protein